MTVDTTFPLTAELVCTPPVITILSCQRAERCNRTISGRNRTRDLPPAGPNATWLFSRDMRSNDSLPPAIPHQLPPAGTVNLPPNMPAYPRTGGVPVTATPYLPTTPPLPSASAACHTNPLSDISFLPSRRFASCVAPLLTPRQLLFAFSRYITRFELIAALKFLYRACVTQP